MSRPGVFVGVLAAWALGCGYIEGELQTPAPATAAAPATSPATAAWAVGAASVDITPAVGYGMAGHAIEARHSLGVWTRLRAHAVVFEDRDGTPLVLIAADLWAISAALADRVTERLQTEHGLPSLGRGQLLLAATHTHHGPGNFSTAKGYAQHAGPAPGFDPVLFEFLAERLAAAAAQAYAQRVPATLEHHVAAVPGVARNRSLAPFRANPEATSLLKANAAFPRCGPSPEASEPDAELGDAIDPCQAIDPELNAVAARAVETGKLIAVTGFFAVHATAMPNRAEVFHGDLFGVATRHARESLALGGDEDVVVALFNGAEGDVSPNWTTQGRAATTALGVRLGDAVALSLQTQGRPLEGTAGYGFVRTNLSSAEVSAPTTVPPGTTGRRALPGKGQFGGAEDGRTKMYKMGFREGRVAKRERREGHGLKRPAVAPPLVALLHPKNDFPTVAPVGLVQLGPLALVGLPGEFTTILGRRIEARVGDALGPAHAVVGVGLASEYLSYFTTPEEYDLQHYEGASMMYGRLAGEAVAGAAQQLAEEPTVDASTPYRYRYAGKTSSARARRQIRRKLRGAAVRVADELSLPRTAVSVQFDDVAATWPPAHPEDPTTPRVRAELRDDTAAAWVPLPGADDGGTGFAMVLVGARTDALQWQATWMSPFAPATRPGAQLRLRVTTVEGKSLCSTPFARGPSSATASPQPLAMLPCAP